MKIAQPPPELNCRGLNEVFLWHGCSTKVADIIVNFGFDERLANDQDLYGAGSYFTVQVCKALQYSRGIIKVLLTMPANGGTPQANREVREQPREEPYVFETPVKARAVEELPCAQQQLSKCIENQDYLGAAAARENIDALTAKGRALRFF